MKQDESKIEYVPEDDSEGKGGKKVKKIKQELKSCQKERAEYLAGWQRAKADYINLEKRIEQEKAEWIKFANSGLILELLPILDSFEEALKHNKDQGITQIYNQLKTILRNQGLEEIKAVGEKFNPDLHEVVENVKGDKKEGIIIEEVQKGYKFNDKVIRSSRVKISK